MILSHEHKFIFIKTNKTGGTSIEIALSKFCGPNDIVTRISPADEEMRSSLGYTGPQNDMLVKPRYRGWMDSVRHRLQKADRRKTKKADFYNHMPASRIRELIPVNIWNSYFKFCVERNPWDRVVSAYYWQNKFEPRQPMIDWLNARGIESLRKRGRELYTIDGSVVVDRVLKFENLADELEEVRKLLGLSEALELPNAKASFRKEKRHYSEVFSDEEKQIISRNFEFEIKSFGYEF